MENRQFAGVEAVQMAVCCCIDVSHQSFLCFARVGLMVRVLAAVRLLATMVVASLEADVV